MNESISRAAGTRNGQELPPEDMDELIRQCGRMPIQRTTLYGRPKPDRINCSYDAPQLLPVVAIAPPVSTDNRGRATQS
jgi:FO synthase